MAIVFGHKIHISIPKFDQNSLFYSYIWPEFTILFLNVPKGEGGSTGLGNIPKKKTIFLVVLATYWTEKNDHRTIFLGVLPPRLLFLKPPHKEIFFSNAKAMPLFWLCSNHWWFGDNLVDIIEIVKLTPVISRHKSLSHSAAAALSWASLTMGLGVAPGIRSWLLGDEETTLGKH